MLTEEKGKGVQKEMIKSLQMVQKKKRKYRFALDLPHSCADEFRGEGLDDLLSQQNGRTQPAPGPKTDNKPQVILNTMQTSMNHVPRVNTFGKVESI